LNKRVTIVIVFEMLKINTHKQQDRHVYVQAFKELRQTISHNVQF